jgi:hypothetical protein
MLKLIWFINNKELYVTMLRSKLICDITSDNVHFGRAPHAIFLTSVYLASCDASSI